MSPTEIIVGLFGLLGSTVVAYLAYKRGARADDDAAEDNAIGKVYEGYGGLLQRVQDDNADLRRRLVAAEEKLDRDADLRYRLARAEERVAALELQISQLKEQIGGGT